VSIVEMSAAPWFAVNLPARPSIATTSRVCLLSPSASRPLKHRRAFCVAVALVLSGASLGCGGDHPEEPTLTAAVRATVDALSRRDMPALWALVDAPTRERLLAILRDVERARDKVPEVWPEGDRAKALAALAGDLLEEIGPDDAGRGPRLLDALLDPGQVTFNQEVLDGLGARDVTLETGPPERAIVFTSVGETFAFVREGQQWRSLFVREHVLEQGPIPMLADHAQKTLALAEEREKAWRASFDPKTPQGSYNLARAAQTARPVDPDALFALLDDDGRKALADVLEAGRAAQRAIQQRVAKPQRRDAYAESGLTRLVDATSDRDLYRRWAKSPDFVPPLAVTDEPQRVEGTPGAPDVTVVTATGKIAMHRDSDGFWRIAGTRAAIAKALSPPPPKPPTPE